LARASTSRPSTPRIAIAIGEGVDERFEQHGVDGGYRRWLGVREGKYRFCFEREVCDTVEVDKVVDGGKANIPPVVVIGVVVVGGGGGASV